MMTINLHNQPLAVFYTTLLVVKLTADVILILIVVELVSREMVEVVVAEILIVVIVLPMVDSTVYFFMSLLCHFTLFFRCKFKWQHIFD